MALSNADSMEIIYPEWQAPSSVRALATSRSGGVSTGGYAALNLATHVEDAPRRVATNRQRFVEALQLPEEPRWLEQVHSSRVVHAGSISTAAPEADAIWSDQPGQVCAVLTADCLPVLMCNSSGTQVAAVHAGWRGLAAGILDNVLAMFAEEGTPAADICAWFGPAIGANAYEVDAPVHAAVVQAAPFCAPAFSGVRAGHWQFDLAGAARLWLAQRGVRRVAGGDLCTFSDNRFYSYRRDSRCGRQATAIWRIS